MGTEHLNYYRLLGVDPGATPEVIQQAFTRLRTEFARKTPDPQTKSRYQQIVYAYEVLSNPSRRSLYDSLLQDTQVAPLQIDIQISREKIPVLPTPQLVYVLVDVHAPAQKEDTQLPLNLCLVLDRSTSMQGERLDRVKTAVEMVFNQLGPEDVISVISFSDRAEVLLPASQVDHKTRTMSRVQGMVASGGTEIYQGLKAGIQEMRQLNMKQYTNHMILLTDGHTYGDAEQCLQLAREVSHEGIGLTAFGIGSEWNDQFLDRLVNPSGGQSGFIDRPEQIIEFLQNRIKGLGMMYAQNVRLILEFPQSVNLRYGFKMVPYAQPLTLGVKDMKLGNIEGRTPLSFLLELTIEAQPMESRIKLPIHIVADIPSRQMREQSFKEQIQLLALEHAPDLQPPEPLVRAVRMLNICRLNEKVWEDMEAGQVNMAATRMKHLTTRFLEAGQTKLAQQAQLEAERLTQMGIGSAEGRKTLKFGTRTLLSQAIDWKQDD